MADAVSPLRAEVIEMSINVEWLINSIISQRYLGKVRIDFISEFLYDEYCTFALKRRVLLKICPSLRGDVEQKLSRLNTIRNFFAHVGQEIIDGPDPRGSSRIPSPRDFSKSVDFKALHDEFLAIEKTVVKTLFETFQAMGGIAVK